MACTSVFYVHAAVRAALHIGGTLTNILGRQCFCKHTGLLFMNMKHLYTLGLVQQSIELVFCFFLDF